MSLRTRDAYNALRTNGSISTDPIRNFKFVVQINKSITDPKFGAPPQGQALIRMGFMNMSGLAQTTTVIPYREGGNNTTERKLPGQTSFGDVTLANGMTFGGHQPWSWTRQIFSVNGGEGINNGNREFRTDVDIYVLHHPQTDVSSTNTSPARTPTRGALKFKLYRAWISGLAFSELDAGGNAVMVQQMTLTHEGFELNFASSHLGYYNR
jgi:phage tail-like protein